MNTDMNVNIKNIETSTIGGPESKKIGNENVEGKMPLIPSDRMENRETKGFLGNNPLLGLVKTLVKIPLGAALVVGGAGAFAIGVPLMLLSVPASAVAYALIPSKTGASMDSLTKSVLSVSLTQAISFAPLVPGAFLMSMGSDMIKGK